MKRITAVAALAVLALLGACAGPKRLPPADQDDVQLPRGPEVPLLLGVGLAEEQDRLELGTSGPALVLDGRQRKLLARLEAGTTLVCVRRDGRVAWETPAAAGAAASLILQPVDPAHRVLHAGIPFRGEFLVVNAPLGPGLTLVNNLGLEDYLKGVVPWEIGRHGRDRLAALEAQAIAARTYTVSHLGVRRARGFDVFATVMDQVYRGAGDEDPLCNEAVARTAGLIMRHEGREITAYYSACCGGVTSEVAEVWPREGRPYLVSHRDAPPGGAPYCADSRWYAWEETWTRARLDEILADTLPAYLAYMGEGSRAVWAGRLFTPDGGHGNPARPGRLRDLEVRRRTTSGRIAELAVVTEAGTYHVRGDRVRWVLAPAGGTPAILRSAFCEVTVEADGDEVRAVRATGHGYGHGIGMCQTGALEMARRGYDFDVILAHYYPGALLVRHTGTPGP